MELEFSCSKEFEKTLSEIDNQFKEIEAIDKDSLNITKRYDDYHRGVRVKGESLQLIE